MQKRFKSKFGWFYLLIGTILINILASFVNGRYDITSEKRFTLTKPVKSMLGRLHEQVNIDILLEGNLKSGLRKLRNSTEALLQEFNEYAELFTKDMEELQEIAQQKDIPNVEEFNKEELVMAIEFADLAEAYD